MKNCCSFWFLKYCLCVLFATKGRGIIIQLLNNGYNFIAL